MCVLWKIPSPYKRDFWRKFTSIMTTQVNRVSVDLVAGCDFPRLQHPRATDPGAGYPGHRPPSRPRAISNWTLCLQLWQQKSLSLKQSWMVPQGTTLPLVRDTIFAVTCWCKMARIFFGCVLQGTWSLIATQNPAAFDHTYLSPCFLSPAQCHTQWCSGDMNFVLSNLNNKASAQT